MCWQRQAILWPYMHHNAKLIRVLGILWPYIITPNSEAEVTIEAKSSDVTTDTKVTAEAKNGRPVTVAYHAYENLADELETKHSTRKAKKGDVEAKHASVKKRPTLCRYQPSPRQFLTLFRESLRAYTRIISLLQYGRPIKNSAWRIYCWSGQQKRFGSFFIWISPRITPASTK